MNKSDILRFQEEAASAYNRLSNEAAGPYTNAIAAYEIALQQARTAEAVEKQNELLDRIAKRLEDM